MIPKTYVKNIKELWKQQKQHHNVTAMGPEATEIYISDLHFWGPSIGLTNEKPIGYKEMFIWQFFSGWWFQPL